MATTFDQLTERPPRWPAIGDSVAKFGLGVVAATLTVCSFLLVDPSHGTSRLSNWLLGYLAVAVFGPFVLLAIPRRFLRGNRPHHGAKPDSTRIARCVAFMGVLSASGLGAVVLAVGELPEPLGSIRGPVAAKVAIAVAFVTVIGAQSATEELFFRILLPLLFVQVFGRSPHRSFHAVAVSVLLFGAAHLPRTPTEFLTHVMFGLLMHQLFSVTRRVSVPVLVHMANNVVTSSLFLHGPGEHVPGLAIMIYAALSLLIWCFRPRRGTWPANQWPGVVRRGVPAFVRASPPRITYVDAARGVALLVIMIENVFIYLPAESGLGLADSTSRGVRAVLAATVEYRGLPFFGILLGFGVCVMLSQGDGVWAARVLRRRGVALVVIGAIHGTLIFSGDILAIFGLTLWPLAWIARRPFLVTWALWLTGALFVMQTAVLPLTLFFLARTNPGGSFGSTLEPGFVLAFTSRPQEWLTYFATAPFLSSGLLFPVLVGYATAPLLLRENTSDVTITRLKIVAGLLGIGSIAACLPYAWSVLGSWGAPEVTAGGAFALVLAQLGGLMGSIACWCVVIVVSAQPATSQTGHGSLMRLATAAGTRSISIYLAHSLVFLVVLAPSLLGVGSLAPLSLLAPAVVALWCALAGMAAKLSCVFSWVPGDLVAGYVQARGCDRCSFVGYGSNHRWP